MHGRTFILFAPLILPLIAAPLPGAEIRAEDEAMERPEAISLGNVLRDVLPREPITEALPTVSLSVAIIESKREAAPLVEAGADPEDVEVEEDTTDESFDKRAKRPGGGWKRAQRGGGGWPKRAERGGDGWPKRAQRPGGGWVKPKRSIFKEAYAVVFG